MAKKIAPYRGLREFPARHFGWREVECKCGLPACFPDRSVLESRAFRIFCTVMDAIRGNLGKPVIVNSWYRCPEHPIEARKQHPGVHSHAIAADIRINRWDVIDAIDAAMYCLRHVHSIAPRITLGFGFEQVGGDGERYVHVDVGGLLPEFQHVRGNCWTY